MQLLPLLHALMAWLLLVVRSRHYQARTAQQEREADGRAAQLQRQRQQRRRHRAPPWAQPQLSSAHFEARQQAVSGLVAAAVHLAILVLKTRLLLLQPPRELAGSAALAGALGGTALIVLLLVVVPLAAPVAFQRHRTAVFVATRLAFFSSAITRSSLGLPSVLQRPPSARPLGALHDTWLLFLGTRSITVALSSLLTPLPLLAHLLPTAYAFHRCRPAPQACSLPLLRHRVWRRRIAWVHRVANAVLLPAPLLAASSPPTTQEEDQQAEAGSDAATAECRTFLAAFQLLLGVVVPTVLVQLMNRRPVAAGGRVTGSSSGSTRLPAGTDSSDSSSQSSQSRRERQPRAWWERMRLTAARCLAAGWARLQRGAAEAEATLAHACELLAGSGPSWVVNAAAWWLSLSAVWAGAGVLEGPAG